MILMADTSCGLLRRFAIFLGLIFSYLMFLAAT